MTDILASKPADLREWIRFFETYFRGPNLPTEGAPPRPLRDYTDRLAELGGYITSSKHQQGSAWPRYYAKYFAWYCGLLSACHIDIAQAMWLRFPNKCPKCGLTPCAYVFNPGLRVHATADPAALRAQARRDLEEDAGLAVRPLAGWFGHILEIWPTNAHASMGTVRDRFHEEQSELIKEIRNVRYSQATDGSITDHERHRRIEEEACDVLCWYLTLGARVLLTVRTDHPYVSHTPGLRQAHIDFDQLIYVEYIRGCDNCKQKPCVCPQTVAVERIDLRDAVASPVALLEARPDERVYNWLVATDTIDVSVYKAVGEFVAVDDRQRREIMALVDQLRKDLPGMSSPFPVLICARPGSGKSFLVHEIAQSLGGLPIVSENLATASDIGAHLGRLYTRIATKHEKPVVAFLDEVDTIVAGDSAYRHLLPALLGERVGFGSGVEGSLSGVVWFFAASQASTSAGFEEYLKSIQKGPDFFRRFRQAGTVLELRESQGGIQKAVQAVAAFRSANKNLKSVEAGVLLYFGTRLWSDAGELMAVARRLAADNAGSLLSLGGIAHAKGFFQFVSANTDKLDSLADRLVNVR
jgi:predicted outer membrane lipoprotein